MKSKYSATYGKEIANCSLRYHPCDGNAVHKSTVAALCPRTAM